MDKTLNHPNTILLVKFYNLHSYTFHRNNVCFLEFKNFFFYHYLFALLFFYYTDIILIFQNSFNFISKGLLLQVGRKITETPPPPHTQESMVLTELGSHLYEKKIVSMIKTYFFFL